MRNASIFCCSSHVVVVCSECVSSNQDAGDGEAHLASFEELNVVVPNVSAFLILTNMVQCKLVRLSDDITRGWRNIQTSNKRSESQRKYFVNYIPHVDKIKLPKIGTRRRSQEFLEEFFSSSKSFLIIQKMTNICNLCRRLYVVACQTSNACWVSRTLTVFGYCFNRLSNVVFIFSMSPVLSATSTSRLQFSGL